MNPRQQRQAVALSYAPTQHAAPKLVASGRGYLAEKILELAQRYGIPIHRDKKLVQILSRLDLEEEIPPEVYKAVAEILAFVYRLNHWRMEKEQANPFKMTEPTRRNKTIDSPV